MSGSSTLRLCFAAMAPALTEAASARLKLQDPSTKDCDTRTVQGNCNNNPKADHLSSPNKFSEHESFPSCELKLKTADDRVDLTNGDTVRSTPKKGKGGGLNLTSSVVPTSGNNKNNSPHLNIGRFTTFSVTGKQLNSLTDGSGEEVKSKGILEGLKRMNQPYFTANNNSNKDQLVVDGSSKNQFNSSDTLRILASKVVSQSVMVNGDNDNDRKKEEEQQSVKKSCVRESGDAHVSFSVRNDGDSNKTISERSTETLKSLPCEIESSGESKTMGMCEHNKKVLFSTKLGEKPDSPVSSLANKSEMRSCEEMRKECVKKQAYLERKVEILLRRLTRTKGKVVENHTKEQLVQYVNFQHKSLQMVAKSIKSEAPCPEVLKEHFLSNEDVKNMSTSQLVKLVRDNQSSKSLPVTDNSAAARYRVMNSTSTVMSPTLQRQSLSASERLGLRVKVMENDLDSDATASSSGGESCDECSSSSSQDYASSSVSLLKRAEWKWAMDRAAIVSRWTWLQAQVSDLEYKIRTQSQVHRQLRNAKGGVVLGDPPTAIDILRKLQGLKPNHPDSHHSASATPTTDTANGKQGSVVASEGSSSTEVSPYNVTRLLSNVDKQASRLTQSLNCISPASSTVGSPGAATTKLPSPTVLNNSVTDSPSGSSVASDMMEHTAENSPFITARSSSSFTNLSQQQQQQSIPELSSSLSSLYPSHSLSHSSSSSSVSDASFQAARCRPLRSYRKRKILRTIDLYKTSVKAVRHSDVRCRCYPPSNPCAMCGGRINNTMSMDAEHMSFNERVALLDASFHPVLSFSQDIPLSIHCEGMLKSGQWQKKPQSKRSKAAEYRRQQKAMLSSFVVPDSVVVKKNHASGSNNNKIPNGRANSSAPSMVNFTTKIKNKYEGKTKVKNAAAKARAAAPLKHKANKVKQKAAKLSKAMKKKKKKEEEEEDLEEMYLDQEVGCPSSSNREDRLNNSGSQSTSAQRRKRVDNAYDINNIEIPHSIAASTRVEQIHYKEIVTPKWRVLEEGEVSSFSSSQDTTTTTATRVPHSREEDIISSTKLVVPLTRVDSLVASPAGRQLEKTNGVSLSVSVSVSAVSSAGKQLEKTNGVSVSLVEQHHGKSLTEEEAAVAGDEETEDLSDEVYRRRHSEPERKEVERNIQLKTPQSTSAARKARARSDAQLTPVTPTPITPTTTTTGQQSQQPTQLSSVTPTPTHTTNTTGQQSQQPTQLSSVTPTPTPTTTTTGQQSQQPTQLSSVTPTPTPTTTTTGQQSQQPTQLTSGTPTPNTADQQPQQPTLQTNAGNSIITTTTTITPTVVGDGGGDAKSAAPVDGGVEDEARPSAACALLTKSLPTMQSSFEEFLKHQHHQQYPSPQQQKQLEQQQSTGRRRNGSSSSTSKRERTSSAGVYDSSALFLPADSKSVEPWPRRTFPLLEDEYARMQNESLLSSSNCEPLHQQVNLPITAEPSGKVYVGGGSSRTRSSSVDIPEDGGGSGGGGTGTAASSRQGSRATSPHPSIDSTSSSTGDDPADPDWVTNLDNRTKITTHHRRSSHGSRGSGGSSSSHYNPLIGDPDWDGCDTPKRRKR